MSEEPRIPDAALAGLERVVNGVIALDPEVAERLASLQGRVICIELSGFGSRLYLIPGQKDIQIFGGYACAPLSHGMVFAPAAVFVAGLGLTVVLNGERIAPQKIAGGLVVLAGLVVLSGAAAGAMRPGAWRGDVLFVAAGTMWAAFTVLMRRWRVDPMRGTLLVSVLSSLIAPAVFGAALLFGAPSGLATSATTEILLQAMMQGIVGGVLSVAALMGVVRLLGAATASILPSFAPFAALGLAVPVLGDWPEMTEIAGVAIAIAGLVLANWRMARS